MLLGLGFTFFSGAVEAWLVDALAATGFTGDLESVFGRGQIVSGIAMLSGSVAGGFIAQATSLGVPFVVASRRPARHVRRRVPAHARRRLHTREGAAGRSTEMRKIAGDVGRVRLAGPAP